MSPATRAQRPQHLTARYTPAHAILAAAMAPISETVWLTSMRLTQRGTATKPRDLHAAIARASVHPDSQPRTLWARIDPNTLLVQSANQLAPSDLLTLASITKQAQISTVHKHGALVEIAGVCNPVIERQRQRRVAPDLEAWFVSRLGQCLDIAEIEVEHMTPLVVRKPERVAAFARAGYRVMATVTDTRALSARLCNGIGHGRAYGLGLLLAKEFRR